VFLELDFSSSHIWRVGVWVEFLVVIVVSSPTMKVGLWSRSSPSFGLIKKDYIDIKSSGFIILSFVGLEFLSKIGMRCRGLLNILAQTTACTLT
jgi:hypothetical protein